MRGTVCNMLGYFASFARSEAVLIVMFDSMMFANTVPGFRSSNEVKSCLFYCSEKFALSIASFYFSFLLEVLRIKPNSLLISQRFV